MIDSCTITRSVDGEFDPITGGYVTDTLLVYSGKCRVKVAPITQAEAGERRNVISTPVLVLPLRDAPPSVGYDAGQEYDSGGYDVAADVEERDTVTVTASTNADIVGMVWSILGAEESTTATARKFKIERRA